MQERGEQASETMKGNQPFSEMPEYIQLNREFIRNVILHLGDLNYVVDLACGDGLLIGLLFRELRHPRADQKPYSTWSKAMNRTRILGVDIAPKSLKLAQEHLAGQGLEVWPETISTAEPASRGVVFFVEALGDCLPVADECVDVVILGNAIHCFTDKAKLLQEVSRVLRRGGIFAFNTTFYGGCMVKGTEEFYGEWVKHAVRYVKQQEAEARGQGSQMAKRQRGRGQRAFSNPWLTPAEYGQTLTAHGLVVLESVEREVQMGPHHFESMSAFEGTWEAELASALLSGYPTQLACDALASGVKPAFETVGVDVVPRFWLEVIGIKNGRPHLHT